MKKIEKLRAFIIDGKHGDKQQWFGLFGFKESVKNGAAFIFQGKREDETVWIGVLGIIGVIALTGLILVTFIREKLSFAAQICIVIVLACFGGLVLLFA